MNQINKADCPVAGSTKKHPLVGFGVYVHWPFCQSKCPYCDFNSHVRAGGIDEERFLKAYLQELEYFAEKMPGEKVSTIFFGGGTPSLMTPKTVETILAAIAGHWGFAPGIEITLEANPTSVEAERFKAYANAGVNRVSLGVQAMNDPDLKALGRLHNVSEAMRALDIAEANFERFSFDLIYARPNQSLTAWERELAEALKRGAGHMSLYQLTIEPETPFWALHRAGKLNIPEHTLSDEFYEVTQELCQGAGLKTYEISNHANPGDECRHNLIYWQYGRYAGIGPGAHGRISEGGAHFATSTEPMPEKWLEMVEKHGHGMVVNDLINHRQQADEMLLMGLRLEGGLNLARMKTMTGYAVAAPKIQDLIDGALLAFSDDCSHLRATPKGRMVLNALVLRVSEGMKRL